MFTGLIGLKELHLQDNTISELPSGVFTGLTRLKEFNLEDKIISEMPSDGSFQPNSPGGVAVISQIFF